MRLFKLGLQCTFALGIAAAVPGAGRAQGAGSVVEVTSGLGRILYALPDDAKVIEARRRLTAEPKNVALVLELSKAQAARRQYKEAVATATGGLALTPNNADLLLERGHRELGLREFEPAKKDLERAAVLDMEQIQVFYHLGLAHYFLGEFKDAATAFAHARSLAKDDDLLIDCSAWLYAAQRRAGDEEKATQTLARITPAVKNTGPHLYFYLQLLRFYQGQVSKEAVLPKKPGSPDDLESELSFNTVSYGVGNWELYHGNVTGAKSLFQAVVQGEAWNSWGFIGSEVELVRLKR